jgi:hypothetical protein
MDIRYAGCCLMRCTVQCVASLKQAQAENQQALTHTRWYNAERRLCLTLRGFLLVLQRLTYDTV